MSFIEATTRVVVKPTTAPTPPTPPPPPDHREKYDELASILRRYGIEPPPFEKVPEEVYTMPKGLALVAMAMMGTYYGVPVWLITGSAAAICITAFLVVKRG